MSKAASGLVVLAGVSLPALSPAQDATLAPAAPVEQGPIEAELSAPGVLTPSQKAAVSDRFGEAFEAALAAYDAGDYRRAFEGWLPLAREGDLAAQRNVAHMLRKGQGVPQNLPRALDFYKRAAERGLVGAQVNLAAMYLAGEGTAPAPLLAASWFARAAKAGDPEAQYQLALLYLNGTGVAQDPQFARALLEAARAGGHERAAARLAAFGAATLAPPASGDGLEALYRGTQAFGE